MKNIRKESTEIDFFVDPRPLTKEEQTKISEYIKLDKLKKSTVRSKRQHKVSL